MSLQPFDFTQPGRDRRRYDVLRQISHDPTRSQHAIAAEVGLSAAAVNRYIHEMIEQGLVQTVGNTNKTTQYHLTADGRAELARLERAQVESLLGFSHELRAVIADTLRVWHRERMRGVVVAGANFNGGLICLVAESVELPVLALIDLNAQRHGEWFLGHVIQSPRVLEAGSWEGCGLMSLGADKREETVLNQLAQHLGLGYVAL